MADANATEAMALGSIQLFSTGLDETEQALTGVGRIESVTAAVLDSVAASDDSTLAVIPEGPYLVPFYRP
jgi:lactate racemase